MTANPSANARRLLLAGFALWAAGTLAIRFAGEHLLFPHQAARLLILYAASFALMAWFIPRLCRRLSPAKETWFQAAALLILPTLILDSFSGAFFARVYPNIDPGAAGAFGGWMLIFCAGAIAGVWTATALSSQLVTTAGK